MSMFEHPHYQNSPPPQVRQQFQILSTAKNIPRSALNSEFVEKGDFDPNEPLDWELLRYPPFIQNMDQNSTVPEIPFIVYKDDNLTDEQYGKWLATQVNNFEYVKCLTMRPGHLVATTPPNMQPTGEF